MARRKAFTKKRRKLFLEEIEEHGNVSKAALAIGISRRHMYRLKEADEEFEGEWEDAEMSYLDRLAEDLARRGEHGEDRQKIRRKGYVDERTGEFKITEEIREQARVKSTAAAIETLRARHPLFKRRQEVEMTGKGGGPIRVQPTGIDWSKLTYDEKAQIRDLMEKALKSEADDTPEG